MVYFTLFFLDSCHEVHTSANGSVMSPNYPNNYPSNANCQYLIKNSDPTKRIMIEFLRFNLQGGWNCGNDRLKIYDGLFTNASIIGGSYGYCGSSIPSARMSTGNALLIVFVSNIGGRYPGFVISYKTLGMF